MPKTTAKPVLAKRTSQAKANTKPQHIVLQAPPETVGQRIGRELVVAILAGLFVRWISSKNRW